MLSLKERIDELKQTRTIVRAPRLPLTLKIQQSLDRLTRYSGVAVSSIHAIDYEAILSKLGPSPAQALSQLTIRELRLVASCLFDTKRQLANDHEFLDKFLDSLRSIKSRIAVKRLIHTYCTHFDPNHTGIKRIGGFLTEVMLKRDWRWDWPKRHREHKIFDPAFVVQHLAGRTNDSQDPKAVLEEAGLGGQLLSSGLSTHVFLTALKAVQKKLETNPKLEHVDQAIAWVQSDSNAKHFTAHYAALANALLLPWADRDPAGGIREKTQTFLLSNLGDPRIDKGPWLRPNPLAHEIMNRWLAQATLEQFLKVVDRVAARHQWEYRRAFWSAYIEKRVVGNSWVVFGSDGAHVARRLAEESTDKFMSKFATLSGASPNQSVLLLKIADLVIADWSHNGRLRIWRKGNLNSPEFDRPSYLAAELRAKPDFEIPHLPPDGWQRKAESYIRKQSGIRVAEYEYMPSRRSHR
jgi:hypothetical protein